MQARFPANSVKIAGVSNTFVRTGERRTTFYFCPTCGGTLYFITDGFEDTIAVPAGAFADPGFPAPKVSVYEGRKHAWVNMPVDMEHFD